MKQRLLLFLAILALVSAFLACGSTASGTNTGTAITATSAPAGATPTSAPAQHFKIGQLVQVGSTWQITITSVKTSQGSEFVKPKSGDIFLVFSIKMKNISAQEQDVSTLQFVLRDTDGQQYNDTFIDGLPSEPSGKVAAGSPLSGAIPYEVPASKKQFTYGFAADLFSSGQVIWDITIK